MKSNFGSVIHFHMNNFHAKETPMKRKDTQKIRVGGDTIVPSRFTSISRAQESSIVSPELGSISRAVPLAKAKK